MPQRVQRKRVKGWRMPENTVSITRPGKYGNPFKVTKDRTAGKAVELFRDALLSGDLAFSVEDVKRELRGKNLACYCKEGDPCHGDILLSVANTEG